MKESFASVVVFVFFLGAGCASVSDSLPDLETSLALPGATPNGIPAPAAQTAAGEPGSVELAAAASAAGTEQPAASGTQPSEPAKEAGKEPASKEAEEFYDPFAKKEETLAEGEEDYDPWEGFNSAIFEFNYKLDKYLLKPVAKGYNFVMPDAVQRGVSNFFHNVRFVPRFFNNLFQAKVKGAGLEMGRFLINTTVGLAGFFDVAKNQFGLETPDEDAGQTLGVYGTKPGPYLVLPILGSFTVRDGIGYIVDLALDPINWLVFPVVEVRDVPSLVEHKNRDTSTFAQIGTRAGYIINERSLNLETFEGVEEATVDLYSAVRNAYLQRRAKAIRE